MVRNWSLQAQHTAPTPPLRPRMLFPKGSEHLYGKLAESEDRGSTLRSRYITYSCMDPLGSAKPGTLKCPKRKMAMSSSKGMLARPA